jgi:hypothetical protein
MKDCSGCLYHSVDGDHEPCVSCDEKGSEYIARLFTTKQAQQNVVMSGVKYDNGKPQWSLLPFKALTEVVEVLTYGAKKYAPDNWKKVPDARRRYIDAGFRHFTAYASGETHDPETGKHHLAHAVCCLLYLIAFDLGEHND